MNKEVLPEIYQLSQSYHENGTEQLGKVLYDEQLAKKAALVGLVVGTVMFSGIPGGGKTTLANYLPRIVSDIEPEDVSRIPTDAELQPIRLVGGKTIIESEEIIDGTSTKKSSIHTIEPIIKPNTKIIFADELTRINPLAINALLEAPEEGALTTTSGRVALDSLMLLISTMNPAEVHQATFKVSAAYASRNKVGAVMGHDLTQSSKRQLINGNKPNPSTIKSIISTKDLLRIRDAANNTLLPDQINDLAIGAIDRAISLYKNDFGIDETSRLYGQIGQVAKVLGLFSGGQPTVEHLRQAVHLSAAARLGSLVTSENVEKEIANFVDKVTA